jgi:hypothetical protein
LRTNTEKIYDLVAHIVRMIPLRDVDYSRMLVHLGGALLLALSTYFTAGIPVHTIMYGWIGGSLIYISGYLQKGTHEFPEENDLQRGFKTDVEVPAKEVSE